MIAGLVCVFSFLGSSLGEEAPQTQVQLQVSADTLAAAIPASEAAESSVLALFGNAATTQYLKELDDGSEFYLMSPEELSQRFFDELSVAELVHNFGSDGASANCGFDVTIESGTDADYFENQWQLQANGEVCFRGGPSF